MVGTGATTVSLWLSLLNLQAGYRDILWPQIIQGAGMSLLFLPLTTMSMDNIPREKMATSTGSWSTSTLAVAGEGHRAAR